jgi:N4-gp56 family major capsid protein
MAVTQTSDVAYNIQDLVSAIVQEELIQNSVMVGTVNDRSAEAGSGLDRISIPRFDALTLQAVSETAEVTPQTITGAQSELILNQHFSYPFAIGDKALTQSKADLVAEAVRNGARVHAAGIDNYLIGLADAAGSRTALSAGPANPLADITSARQQMNSAFLPMSDRYLLVSPAFEAAILNEATFIRADAYGSSQPVMNGEIGRILGFTVLMSPSAGIVDDGFIAYHRSGLFFARQIAAKLEQERNVLGHRDEYSLSQLYGGVAADDASSRIFVFDADGL